MMAGTLDRRVRFDRAPKPWPLDDAGQPVPQWARVYECWAERRPLQGRELYAAQQLAARADVEFRIRYPPEVTITPDESLRLVDLFDRERPYDITYVAEIGRREGLSVIAAARAE